MILGRTLANIDQVWRAVQLTIIVPHSVNHFQAKRSTSWIKTMSQPNDWSKATRDYKRMKAQKGVWRPVNTQSHSLAGKEKEKMDFHIGIREKEYSSVTNTKSTTTENDSRKNSENTVAEIQTSNQDVESKSKVVRDIWSSSEPIKTFVSVKHVKSEASVECIKENQGTVNIEPSTTTDLKDSAESEQQQNCSKEDIEILEYNKDVEESPETSGHLVNVKVDDSLLRFVKGKGGKVQKMLNRIYRAIEEDRDATLTSATHLKQP
jgi:hypothetical protein